MEGLPRCSPGPSGPAYVPPSTPGWVAANRTGSAPISSLCAITALPSFMTSRSASGAAAAWRFVAEVVGAEVELEAVGRAAARRSHDAGVVDQEVEPVVLQLEALGEQAHRGEVREVELLELGLR